jgi:hypothetical protein
MTCHLTLFLACFSVYFSRFYHQSSRILDQLPMISRVLKLPIIRSIDEENRRKCIEAPNTQFFYEKVTFRDFLPLEAHVLNPS